MKRYIQINWHSLLYLNVCILFHLISFSIFFIASRHHPAIMGAGVIAYLLGLRHAFDADHIAAIDNTVRKLVEQKQDSTGVGFFFSLGHSTVVIVMSLVLSWFVHWSRNQFAFVSHIGGIFGSLVSGVFLLLIALINCLTLYKLFNTYHRKKCSAQAADEDGLAKPYGFLTHLFKRLFHLVNRSCHMYPIGFLFGLGFDTTTEVAVLALSAELTKGFFSFSAILSIPLLFASGMIIIDTLDSVMMSKAYKYALLNPIRRTIYNIVVTSLSVLAALFIGFVELGQTFSSLFQWKGAFWHFIGMMNLNSIGYLLVSLLLAAWLVAFVLWRRKDTALLKQ
jgi:high-affinity nickel-transport protein